MAELATYTGVTPISKKLTNSAIGRGLRVVLNSSGVVALAGIGVPGHYVTLQSGAADEVVPVVPLGTPAKIPAVASEAVAVGDKAYSAANGKFSKTSTDAVEVGVWTLAASADGVLGEVQLYGAAVYTIEDNS